MESGLFKEQNTEKWNETRELSNKLGEYIATMKEVDEALKEKPLHVDLKKLKADLNELIELTKKRISALMPPEGPPGEPTLTRADPGTLLFGTKTLADNQFKDFMIRAFDDKRPLELLRLIANFTQNYTSKKLKRMRSKRKKSANVEEIDKEIDEESGQCNGSTGPSEKSPRPWNIPLIYRGDLLQVDDEMLFMTVAKIRLKASIFSDHKTVAAIVCLLNAKKQLVFWGVVNWKGEDVCQTFPEATGITSIEQLDKGLPFQQIMTLLLMAVNGKRLVGYNLEEDLQALSISHDKKLDLMEYFKDDSGPFALEDLKYVPNWIDVVEQRRNVPDNNRFIHDSRRLLCMYNWMQNNHKDYASFAESPAAEIARKERNCRTENHSLKSNDDTEICRCSV